MRQRLRNFWRRSRSDKWLFVQSYCLLGISRLAIDTLAFKRLAGYLGRPCAESPDQIGAPELEATRRVSWAVESASRFTPWKSNCFPQAIAAQYLLRRRRISTTLYLGCRIEEQGEMKAHAWLRSGPRIVTGRPGHRAYRVVATFATAGGKTA
jgi:hypothetical protein